MAYRSNILLGRLLKASGYKGAVAVKLEKEFVDNIPEMESVFLESEGKLVPFFISALEYSGGDILKISFQGYESAGKISEFTGSGLFLTEYPGERKEDNRTGAIEGFTVLDQDDNVLGTITEVIINPGQWLMNIESDAGKELLVPLHEDLIIDINPDKKVLTLQIPEGLVNLND